MVRVIAKRLPEPRADEEGHRLLGPEPRTHALRAAAGRSGSHQERRRRVFGATGEQPRLHKTVVELQAHLAELEVALKA